MESSDKLDYIQRYEERLKIHGYSPKTLGWGENGRQNIRFNILSKQAIQHPDSSVLDVGCGFADLYKFLKENGWKGIYTGIDINPSLLEVAKKNNPSIELYETDITKNQIIKSHDYVIASGIFNAKLNKTDNIEHIKETMTCMFKYAKHALCVDFLSSYVDFQKEGAWHTDPAWLIPFVRTLSRRFILRFDYMPYEFSIIIFKNDSITRDNIFQE